MEAEMKKRVILVDRDEFQERYVLDAKANKYVVDYDYVYNDYDDITETPIKMTSHIHEEYDLDEYLIQVQDEMEVDRLDDYCGLDVVAYLFDTGNSLWGGCGDSYLTLVTRDSKVFCIAWEKLSEEDCMKLIPCPEKDFKSFRKSIYILDEGENCGGWYWYAVYRTGVYLRVHESIMPFLSDYLKEEFEDSALENVILALN
jgi:hypothetical protein